MKKKIITLCLVIALLSVAVIGGTLAYFTDVDQATNEFTVGNVDIDLYETVGHTDLAGHDKSGAIKVDGEEGQTLTEIGRGDDVAFNVTYGPAMPGDTLTKVITVENPGSEDAYVAIAIKHLGYGRTEPVSEYSFNSLIDNYYEGKGYGDTEMQALMDEMFRAGVELEDGVDSGWNRPIYTKKGNNESPVRYYPELTAEDLVDPTGAADHYGKYDVATLLGVDYMVSSYNPTKGAYNAPSGFNRMLEKADYAELTKGSRVWVYYLYLPAGESYTMDISIKIPNVIDETSINAFNGMVLDVQASAIQATGFQSAKAAFTELNATYPISYSKVEAPAAPAPGEGEEG